MDDKQELTKLKSLYAALLHTSLNLVTLLDVDIKNNLGRRKYDEAAKVFKEQVYKSIEEFNDNRDDQFVSEPGS